MISVKPLVAKYSNGPPFSPVKSGIWSTPIEIEWIEFEVVFVEFVLKVKAVSKPSEAVWLPQ